MSDQSVWTDEIDTLIGNVLVSDLPTFQAAEGQISRIVPDPFRFLAVMGLAEIAAQWEQVSGTAPAEPGPARLLAELRFAANGGFLVAERPPFRPRVVE